MYGLMSFIATNYGEEALYKAMRQIGEMFRPTRDVVLTLTPEEMAQFRAESFRFHLSGPGALGDITVVDEEDRYSIILDPCGTGGRMRRNGRTEPPYNYGSTRKAYPWSWGKAGVPYYCTHCCVFSEILPIEWVGYPARIHEPPEKNSDPCRLYIYKKPELIPEKYFTRLGKTKDPSKFKV